jgi:hypothetical protein
MVHRIAAGKNDRTEIENLNLLLPEFLRLNGLHLNERDEIYF